MSSGKDQMQRPVEQRHAPKRRTERAAPSARAGSSASPSGNGRSSSSWSGIGCSRPPFFLTAKLVWDWVPTEWTVGDRIALVIKDAVVAILPAVLAICIVAAQRLDPSMFVGRVPKPNSAVDINNRFILNTVEQFILYFIGNAGLALYCPPQEARTLIVLTVLFVLGRMLFWVGYHYNPYVRAFGFGITFYPTVAVYLWLILRMAFGIEIRI